MMPARPLRPADPSARLALGASVVLAASLGLAFSVGLGEERLPQPTSVRLEGSLAAAVGCPDGGPCPALEMTPGALAPGWLDGLSGGQRRFLAPQALPAFTLEVELPAGRHDYRARATGSDGEWVSGAGGLLDGAPLTLELATSRRVTFRYSAVTRWVTDDVSHPATVATGTFQRALGCPQDWDSTCLQGWLQDPDGDGLSTFSTRLVPPGHHEVLAAPALPGAAPAERTAFRVLRAAEQVRFVWSPRWARVVVEFPERPPKAEAEAAARELLEEPGP
jgi:hypothetical protein